MEVGVVAADGVGELVVVDDEVAGLCVVGLFGCAGWADDEGDVGVGCLPAVAVGAVYSSEVAVFAGGSEVVGVVPGAAFEGGDDVVDVGGGGGAFGAADLAGVVVSFEDSFADCLPWASVGGVSAHGLSLSSVSACAMPFDPGNRSSRVSSSWL